MTLIDACNLLLSDLELISWQRGISFRGQLHHTTQDSRRNLKTFNYAFFLKQLTLKSCSDQVRFYFSMFESSMSSTLNSHLGRSTTSSDTGSPLTAKDCPSIHPLQACDIWNIANFPHRFTLVLREQLRHSTQDSSWYHTINYSFICFVCTLCRNGAVIPS